ncbi:MAG: transcriptional regulator, partial [Ilumatobacter sp.]
APSYSELDLNDPEMTPIVETLSTILTGSEPNPTLVMDRHWNLVMANDAAMALVRELDDPPPDVMANVVRLTLHPAGLASLIENVAEVAVHLADRLRRQLAITGDPVVADLLREALALAPDSESVHPIAAAPTIPVRIRIDGATRSFVSTVATFGAPIDVTTSELVIETFYEV